MCILPLYMPYVRRPMARYKKWCTRWEQKQKPTEAHYLVNTRRVPVQRAVNWAGWNTLPVQSPRHEAA